VTLPIDIPHYEFVDEADTDELSRSLCFVADKSDVEKQNERNKGNDGTPFEEAVRLTGK